MLHLLVDTSTWLDLSKRRHSQRWIVALRVPIHQGEIELPVPSLVIDQYERNRERVQASMTAGVAQRFKLIRQDLDDYGGTDTGPCWQAQTPSYVRRSRSAERHEAQKRRLAAHPDVARDLPHCAWGEPSGIMINR